MSAQKIPQHRHSPFGRLVALVGAALFGLQPAFAADSGAANPTAQIQPHQALYALSLDTAKSTSGVVGASGGMYYKWGETCEGWTLEQRFRLRLAYAEEDNTEIGSTLVTFESKDGLRYRFNERRTRNGEIEEEIRGEAHLNGPGKGGVAEFVKPESSTIDLKPGVIFPTAHTLALLTAAKAQEQFIARYVFDGASVENAGEISAVIGPQLKPAGDKAAKPLNSALLQHPSWNMRLAFFPSESEADQTQPDYELSMRLLENGISQDMKLDYSDYVIRAALTEVEPLPKPHC